MLLNFIIPFEKFKEINKIQRGWVLMLAQMRQERFSQLVLSMKNYNKDNQKLREDYNPTKTYDFKLNLKVKRLQHKLSIRQLSIDTGIAQSYISQLENGVYKNPTADILVKLSKAFNCTIDDLITILDK
jgi:putative transcriptional regulator